MKKIEDYKGKKIAVNCTTPKQSEAFCKLMHENGLKWDNGKSYLQESNWEHFREKICYDFNENVCLNIEYFVKNGYTILPATDFLEEEFVYGQEYEFSYNKNFKQVFKEQFMCRLPNGVFVGWNGEEISGYKYCRKINTERNEAITTIKELVSKHSINQNEVF